MGLRCSRLPISKLLNATGIPLAVSTGWDVIEKLADRVHPIFPEIIRQTVKGDVVYNDDINMIVQDLMAEKKDETQMPTRAGIFTIGIPLIFDD